MTDEDRLVEVTERASPCWDCPHRADVPGDAHSRCAHLTAVALFITGGDRELLDFDPRGAEWTAWPWNFDPIWLRACRLKTVGATTPPVPATTP